MEGLIWQIPTILPALAGPANACHGGKNSASYNFLKLKLHSSLMRLLHHCIVRCRILYRECTHRVCACRAVAIACSSPLLPHLPCLPCLPCPPPSPPPFFFFVPVPNSSSTVPKVGRINPQISTASREAKSGRQVTPPPKARDPRTQRPQCAPSPRAQENPRLTGDSLASVKLQSNNTLNPLELSSISSRSPRHLPCHSVVARYGCTLPRHDIR